MRLQACKRVIAWARAFGERCLRCVNPLDRRSVRLQAREVPYLSGIADCLVRSLSILVLMLVILTLSMSAAPQAAQQGDRLRGAGSISEASAECARRAALCTPLQSSD